MKEWKEIPEQGECHKTTMIGRVEYILKSNLYTNAEKIEMFKFLKRLKAN